MKELDDFTVERLQAIAEHNALVFPPSHAEAASLARIALAAKTAAWWSDPTFYDCLFIHSAGAGGSTGIPIPPVLWACPQQNVPAIPDGWIKCSERMPKVGDVVITAYQGATNIGEMERSGRDYRYFTSIASGRELPADFWMPLPAPPTTEK